MTFGETPLDDLWRGRDLSGLTKGAAGKHPLPIFAPPQWLHPNPCSLQKWGLCVGDPSVLHCCPRQEGSVAPPEAVEDPQFLPEQDDPFQGTLGPGRLSCTRDPIRLPGPAGNVMGNSNPLLRGPFWVGTPPLVFRRLLPSFLLLQNTSRVRRLQHDCCAFKLQCVLF